MMVTVRGHVVGLNLSDVEVNTHTFKEIHTFQDVFLSADILCFVFAAPDLLSKKISLLASSQNIVLF